MHRIGSLIFLLCFNVLHAYDGIIQVGERLFFTELAISEEEHERGYMKRFYIPAFATMLFMFEEAEDLDFWMQDMHLSLDIHFYDGDAELINVHRNVPPCRVEECPVYSSAAPAQWVLEARPGVLPPAKRFIWRAFLD